MKRSEDTPCVRPRLRHLRRHGKYSTAAVAEKIGVTSRQLYNYERGLAPIPSDKLILLCKLYGVSADYILRLSGGEIRSDKIDCNKITKSEE